MQLRARRMPSNARRLIRICPPSHYSGMSPKLDQQCIDTIRFLAVDMVQKAASDHPGLPLHTLLNLTDCELTLDNIREFCQWGGKTPGHPEWGIYRVLKRPLGCWGRDWPMPWASPLRRHSSPRATTPQGELLPPSIGARLAVEMGASQGWEKYIDPHGAMLGVNRFGASVPGETVMREYGFTVDRVCTAARVLLA